jgi:hypothetical protein
MADRLNTPWTIGSVEVPTRLALAPMAGVSVQAFRRQGRRYGAGLVCSEMVSCAGLSHRNERTLGYLRIGADEHPLAVQIFGSEPALMAEAARMVEAAGADLVDINFGCPVRKVTKTGAGASLLDEPHRAAAIVEGVAQAVDVPVCVKMRRGVENGSRTALEVGPQLVEAGAASLTLHPRSAQQMYTGTADHSLTADLVELVDVPRPGTIPQALRERARSPGDRRAGRGTPPRSGARRERRAGAPRGRSAGRRERRARSARLDLRGRLERPRGPFGPPVKFNGGRND